MPPVKPAAPPPAGRKTVRLLVFGDSLVAGYGLPAQDGFQAQLGRALSADGYPVEILDGGVSGDTSAGGRARIEWALADHPDAALVELGANDGLRASDPAQMEANLAAILDTLAAHHVRVLLTGMEAPPNLGAAYGAQFRAVFARLGKRPGVTFDRFFLKGVAGNPVLIQEDGLHPNAKGVAIEVARMKPIVEGLFFEKKKQKTFVRLSRSVERRASVMSKYYITTPIFYVNGSPHLGHAYTAIAADAVARFKRLDGVDTHFLSGTDEHGQKVEKAAADAGLAPQDFTDGVSAEFRNLLAALDISNDDFIRTTEPRHKAGAIALWERLAANGDIYLGHYEGWYAVRDEDFYSADDLVTLEDGTRLAPTGAPVEWVREPNYLFRLSAYEDRCWRIMRLTRISSAHRRKPQRDSERSSGAG